MRVVIASTGSAGGNRAIPHARSHVVVKDDALDWQAQLGARAGLGGAGHRQCRTFPVVEGEALLDTPKSDAVTVLIAVRRHTPQAHACIRDRDGQHRASVTRTTHTVERRRN
jgi:hypothetical protein